MKKLNFFNNSNFKNYPEKIPLMSSNRVGTVESLSISRNEVDDTKNWFRRRFCILILIGILIIIILMISVIILFIFSLQLKDVRSDAAKALHLSQDQIGQLSKNIKQPLEQLIPAIEKLKNLPLPPPFAAPPSQPTIVLSKDADILPIKPIIVEHSTKNENFQRSPNTKYNWKGCENHGKCQLNGYENAPLVILSLDGFSREYLDRKIVKTFDFIAECGAKAEKVFPSFPSKTFPNHYSIVTGLYPESHGITDNNVYDPQISDVLESMKSTKKSEFFGGEPIWSAYKKLTGKRAHCLFWVGCPYGDPRYRPDVSPPYDGSLPFKNRADLIIDWLKLPVETRPGLITAYLHEPDGAGHWQVDDSDVDKKLEEIDDYLDYLMNRLSEEKLLECVNFIILSDHGMQKLNKTIFYEDFIDVHDLIPASGVIGRIYSKNSNRTASEIAENFRCKIENVKTNTREDIPIRKHFSKSQRVGDVILEGPKGTTFSRKNEGYVQLKGDHGYDYLHSSMETIFFGRGPSIQKNVTILGGFQNIQYMNLWLNLLNIEGKVANNGSRSFFDQILIKKIQRDFLNNQIKKCPSNNLTKLIKCYGNDEIPEKLSNKIESCQSIFQNLPLYSDQYCYQNYCEKSIILKKNDQKDKRRIIIENISLNDSNIFRSKFKFEFIDFQYEQKCLNHSTNSVSIGFQHENVLSQISDAQIDSFSNFFIKKILIPLQNKTNEYLKKYQKLLIITGTATDQNNDGIDDNNGNQITHLYRIIIKCPNNWLSINPPICSNPDEIQILSFLFPNFQSFSTISCMTFDQILLDYSSTLSDIENISGIQFQFHQLSPHQNSVLRQKIITSIW